MRMSTFGLSFSRSVNSAVERNSGSHFSSMWLLMMSWISMTTGFERHTSFRRSSPPARRNIYTQTHTHREHISRTQSKTQWRQMVACVLMCLIWMLKMSNMKNIWGWQTLRKKLPTVGNPTENSSPSWLPLRSSSFPQSLCSLHLPRLLSVLVHRSGHVSLFISLLYFLSSHFARTQPYMHTHAHTQASEMRTSRAIGVESVDERRPIWDWMTEWLKEWRAKAVKPSVSLHHSRRQEPTLRCKSGSQSRSYRVRSTRIGIFTQIHSQNHYFNGIYGRRVTNDEGHAPELKSCQQVDCTVNPVSFEVNLKSVCCVTMMCK